jgi:Protein of unknown function with HXXEE motif
MITKKLKMHFLLTAFLLVAHICEEWFTGFHDVSPFMLWMGRQFTTTQSAIFFTFMMMVWLALVISLVFLSERRVWIYRMLSIFSFLYIFELHHPIHALLLGRYYPGAITGLLFLFMGILFWKELKKNMIHSK